MCIHVCVYVEGTAEKKPGPEESSQWEPEWDCPGGSKNHRRRNSERSGRAGVTQRGSAKKKTTTYYLEDPKNWRKDGKREGWQQTGQKEEGM